MLDYADMMKEGLFLPDYRHPMVRIIFDDERHNTGWHRYQLHHFGKARQSTVRAIEVCAPDNNGAPRFAQLKIG